MNHLRVPASVRLLVLLSLVTLGLPSVRPPPMAAGMQDTRGLETVGPTAPQVRYGKSHALVVGVSKYRQGWQQLNTVPNDLLALKSALERQRFEEVRVLEDPTLAEFRIALGGSLANAGPSDRVVIYFGGHGYTRVNGKDGTAKGYLVFSDTPLASGTDDSRLAATALPVDELHDASLTTRAKHVLVVLDSCFSGSVLDVRGESVPASINDLLDRPVRLFITAGSANQTVPAESVFTPRLVKGLAGLADMSRDGYVTGAELGIFLHQQVTNYSAGAQTPRWGKTRDRRFDQGDIVFKIDASATASTDPVAQAMEMAFRYREGRDLPQDLDAAVQQYEIACKANVLSACREAGRLLTRDGNSPDRDARAFRLFSYACDRGHLPGCRAVGWAYLNGRGATKDMDRAIAVLSPACEGHDMSSCHNLAEAYWAKTDDLPAGGIPDSRVFPDSRWPFVRTALTLWTQSCHAGVAQGCWMAGMAYRTGEKNVKVSPIDALWYQGRALKLYELACDNSDAQACFEGAMSWKDITGTMREQDLALKIADLLRRGCLLGSREACQELTGRKR